MTVCLVFVHRPTQHVPIEARNGRLIRVNASETSDNAEMMLIPFSGLFLMLGNH